MPFEVNIKTIHNIEVIQLLDPVLGVSIDILSKGALLNHWSLKHQDQIHEFIAGNALEKRWQFEKQGFRSAKMSPYVCRLMNGQYEHLNKNYTMDQYYMGDHAIHGILYDAPFGVKSKIADEHKASIILAYSYTGNDRGYPFQYSIEVMWTLEKENKITVQTKVTNQSEVVIPIVDGWHPYFTMGESIDHCTLQFTCKGKMEYNSELLPTGHLKMEQSFDQGKKIENLNLDDGFELNPKDLSCSLENKQFLLKIIPTINYPYLQIYTPPDRKSIAIENISGAPNAFNNKIGLQLVKPQENIIFETTYQVFVK